MKERHLENKGRFKKENAMKRFRNALATVALAAVLCVIFMPASGFAQANRIVIDGSTTVGPIAKAFAEYYMAKNPGVNITVSESGSGNGAKSLINGTCDVADMSRFMKDEEFKAAIEKGVYPIGTVVAIDGLAIVVHPSSPIQGLTIVQIREIYTGKLTNWKEIGGPNVAIVLISRDTNSGTYESFESLVMPSATSASDSSTRPSRRSRSTTCIPTTRPSRRASTRSRGRSSCSRTVIRRWGAGSTAS
jgi:phosphate binding protein